MATYVVGGKNPDSNVLYVLNLYLYHRVKCAYKREPSSCSYVYEKKKRLHVVVVLQDKQRIHLFSLFIYLNPCLVALTISTLFWMNLYNFNVDGEYYET